MKTLKVYKVTFGQVLDNINDVINMDNRTVIAQDVENAIICANVKLTKKELKNYYPQEVTLITVLD